MQKIERLRFKVRYDQKCPVVFLARFASFSNSTPSIISIMSVNPCKHFFALFNSLETITKILSLEMLLHAFVALHIAIENIESSETNNSFLLTALLSALLKSQADTSLDEQIGANSFTRTALFRYIEINMELNFIL